MSDRIEYSVNRARPIEIAAHLRRCDTAFVPALSVRVDIDAYASKILDKAVRFEAWQAKDLVGLVATYCNDPLRRAAFVTSVSVLPTLQARGIASELMRQCFDHVSALGYGQIELEVDQHSRAAVSLYQKLGFATVHASGSLLTMRMTLRK